LLNTKSNTRSVLMKQTDFPAFSFFSSFNLEIVARSILNHSASFSCNEFSFNNLYKSTSNFRNVLEHDRTLVSKSSGFKPSKSLFVYSGTISITQQIDSHAKVTCFPCWNSYFMQDQNITFHRSSYSLLFYEFMFNIKFIYYYLL